MFRPELIEAIRDYRYFLDRNYPPSATIKLVGDKYALTGNERSVLYRGVSSSFAASVREKKKIHRLLNDTVLVDTHNILFTIANYLLGKPVFISDDSFLRDTGELHGRFSNHKILEHTFLLLIQFILKNKKKKYIFYLDRPVSNSGKLSLRFVDFFRENKINGESYTVYSPDHQLIQEEKGVICTSDSVIIQQCKLKVFDLSEYILTHNFNPAFDSVKTALESP